MANDKSSMQLISRGILSENPIFKLALSMCPAVGISTTVMNGFMLGIAVLFVQVFSSVTIAIFKNVIHPRIRIPTYTLTIATWVTVIDLVLAAYLPEAYAKMGIFVKLIVAFAIITMRLEMFASKETVNAFFLGRSRHGAWFYGRYDDHRFCPGASRLRGHIRLRCSWFQTTVFLHPAQCRFFRGRFDDGFFQLD